MFKILSIDGGGIKGLYSAIVLREIEKSKGKINEHFDMICGTSTGGLVALALAADIPIEKIIDFYENYGPKIFPSKNSLIRGSRFIRQLFFSSKYNNKALIKILKEIFGNRIVDQSKVCLCIPAVDLANFKGIVFKTSHQPHLNRDSKLKMMDVALATSAAPTYFPIVSIPNVTSLCVDGGLWANNPTLIGIIDALSYFVGKGNYFKELGVLSIGNLSTDDGWGSKSRNASIIKWNKKIISLTLNSQSKSIENILKIASEKELFLMKKYVRIPDPNLNNAQRKIISMDRSDKRAINAIRDIALKQAHEWKNKNDIKPFFALKTKGWNFPFENINH